MENNYKIIQELRLKIETLNKTKMMPQGVVSPVETIHQFASTNYQANKTGYFIFLNDLIRIADLANLIIISFYIFFLSFLI